MAVFTNFLLISLLKSVMFVVPNVVQSSSESIASCELGSFFDRAESQCKKCFVCPANHIIDIPCAKFTDQKCRPFQYRFDFINANVKVKASANSKKLESSVGQTADKGGNDLRHVDSELTTVDSEDKYWKTLAFALIGLLSILIIGTFIILIFVYEKLQRSIVIKQSEEGDLMDDADSGYVVLRTIHNLATHRPYNTYPTNFGPREHQHHQHQPPLALTAPPPGPRPPASATSIDSGRPADSLSTCVGTPLPSNGNLSLYPQTYQPQRRLLQYDADDVFESDDNTSVLNHSRPLLDQNVTTT